MSEKNYDVIILGSGFAGSMLATILARHAVRVLLLDSGTHPRFSIGESTAPHATMLMRIIAARYDVPEIGYCTFSKSLRKHVTTACGIKRNFGFVYHQAGQPQRREHLVESIFSDLPYGTEHHLFRQDIDSYLFHAAVGYGADAIQGAKVDDLEVSDDGTTVWVGDQRFEGEYLVDATGYKSLLATKLGLREEPTRSKTQSRSLFNHFVDVTPYEECSAPGLDLVPNAFSEGTLHHHFDGGWLWVIPFNNHDKSTNPLVSVGLSLDLRRFPRPDGPPEEEFRTFLSQFPSIEEQFRNARAVRKWVSTGRIQYSSTQTVGPRFCLLAHSAGFIDALFSRGLVSTTQAIHALSGRLLEAVEHRDWSMERFEYMEVLQQSLHDCNDRLVSCAYASWQHFDLWTAWYRLWAVGSLLGGMRLNRALSKYLETKDPSYLHLEDGLVRPGLLCPDYPAYCELFDAGADVIESVEEKEFTPQDGARRIEGLLANTPFAGPILASGLFRYQPSQWKPASNLNLRSMISLLRWARRDAPSEIRDRYLDYKTSTVLKAGLSYFGDRDPLQLS